MIRRALLPLVGVLMLAVAASRVDAQETAVRFEISGVADSTFSFALGRHGWVQPGQRGIVVDPRQRDALVARFRVIRVQDGLATALVTGQTTPLTPQHAALLDQPSPAFYRQWIFWVGVALGGLTGFVLGAQ